jgi:sugar O-acyltransferase (sialic acid O-acetyltransferase NeuD family)
MKNLIIIGAGGLGRELLQWIKDINAVKLVWNVKGFIDDNLNQLTNINCSHDIIGTVKDWIPNHNEIFVCAIANPLLKENIVRQMKLKGANFTNVIHPNAIIGSENTIGEGLILYPFARITVNCSIGNFVTIQSSAIGHDAFVNDFSTISSNCLITGNTTVGKRVFVGSNSTIIPNTIIADDVYIGAGSVVINNISSGLKVMGNPARIFTPPNKN